MSLDSVAAYSEQPGEGGQGEGIEPVNPDLDESETVNVAGDEGGNVDTDDNADDE